MKNDSIITDLKKPKKKSLARDVWIRLRRNKLAVLGLIVLTLIVLASVFAPLIAPQGIDDQDLKVRFMAPCKDYIFGTDNYGRDIFSRVLYGGRVSLSTGLISAAIASSLGIVLGLFAGYYGKQTDMIIMRFCDILMAVPNILLAIAIAASLGPGIMNAMIAVSIANIPKMARVTRAAVLSQVNMEYIEAAKSIRSSNTRITFRHVLPNALSPVIVMITANVSNGIMTAASLSFLGLGAQAPNPEWGCMLSSGRQFLRDYPWLTFFPGLAIFLVVLSLNFIGDGLRDALDPKLKN